MLVRRPIYDEEKNSLGEAYVEELLTMRSDAVYDFFGGASVKKKETVNLTIEKEEIQ